MENVGGLCFCLMSIEAMSEIDWDKEKITSKEWLKIDVTQDSIFHAIQHLGLQRLNVLELDKKHLTKKTIHGLICISENKIPLVDQKPFIFDVDSHHFGPTQVSTQIKENLIQKKRIFQQNIENADMTINLVNYALLASPSNFGERCGPFLQNYFDSRMETAIIEGNDLLASVIPIAFVHNYTAKKFPATSNNVVTYFGCYRSTVSFDRSDDRFLKIDPSGDLIEFELSDSGLLHFCLTMEEFGVTKIFAIVEDNTKELIEELSEVRKQICEESDGKVNALDTSSFLNNSTVLDDDDEEEAVENEERRYSALASLTEAMENVIESSDYELLIENPEGEKEADQSFVEHSNSLIEEETLKRFRRLIKEISAAKREFKQLWFEGMENYQLVLDPEFDAFMESYRMILHQDEKEIKRAIEVIEEKAVEEFQKEESAKENSIPIIEKLHLTESIQKEDEEVFKGRKRRAPYTAAPKTPKTPKSTKKTA